MTVFNVTKHTATVISPNALPPNKLFTVNEISEPYLSVQRHKWIQRLKMALCMTFVKYYIAKSQQKLGLGEEERKLSK